MKGCGGNLVLWSSFLLLFLCSRWREVLTSTDLLTPSLTCWFKVSDLYYLIYDQDMGLEEARNVCSSHTYLRLAVFDNISRDGVDTFLTLNHTADEFWVDAQRSDSKEIPLSKANYVWATNETLPIGTNEWAKHEPEPHDLLLRLRFRNGTWQYWGEAVSLWGPRDHHKPLCQSTMTVRSSDNLPTLSWNRLGKNGHMFGFSNETRTLSDARDACKQQGDDVRLATLDRVFEEVAEHKLHWYPEQPFWVDAEHSYYNSHDKFKWATGKYVDSSQFSRESRTGLVLTQTQGRAILVEASDTLSFPYICERLPGVQDIPDMFRPCLKEDTTTIPPTMKSPRYAMATMKATTSTMMTTMMKTTPTTTTATRKKKTKGKKNSSSEKKDKGDSSTECKEKPEKDKNDNMLMSFNMTTEDLHEMLKAISAYLSVNKSTLSATIRKKTSAQDTRGSAQATGCVGLLLLLLVLILIVVPDLISALQVVTRNRINAVARHEGHDRNKKDKVTSRGVTSA